MRLQVPPLVGVVVDPLVPTKEPQESTTVTPAEIIYHRRVQVLDRAGQTSVAERLAGIGAELALQEFSRPAFHRQHFARLADLNAQFQGWLQHYNTRRRNHGDFMRGRTPFAVMEAHLS